LQHSSQLFDEKGVKNTQKEYEYCIFLIFAHSFSGEYLPFQHFMLVFLAFQRSTLMNWQTCGLIERG